jgi:hypothetical protein
MWGKPKGPGVNAVVDRENPLQPRFLEEQQRPEEIKMRKTLVTILCSALIAASSIQAAVAAEHHHARKASRKPVMVNDQHRNSSNEQPRDSNVDGMCGVLPGPCQ